MSSRKDSKKDKHIDIRLHLKTSLEIAEKERQRMVINQPPTSEERILSKSFISK
jgi:hypothetical protein